MQNSTAYGLIDFGRKIFFNKALKANARQEHPAGATRARRG
jgi:hypothetical protein